MRKLFCLVFGVIFFFSGIIFSFPVYGAFGNISTIVGTGTAGSGGDGGPAASAQLNFNQGIAVDAAGNIYISDLNNGRIRKVDAVTGNISTLTTGLTPRGLHFDESSGLLYVVDFNANLVYSVNSSGTKTIVAGGGSGGCATETAPCGDGGPATDAQLAGPHDVVVDSDGNIYISQIVYHKVRKVDAITGNISTYAGTGVGGYSGDNGPATSAQIQGTYGMGIDADDNVYLAEYHGRRLRRIDAVTNVITTFSGDGSLGSSGDGGDAGSATMSPFDVSFDSMGNIYVSDWAGNSVRMIDANTNIITTVAGNGASCSVSTDPCGDGGPATGAQLNNVFAIDFDSDDNLYLSPQSQNRIRLVEYLPPPPSNSTEAEISIDVNDFLTFAIANPASGDEPAGDQPFGAGSQITDLTSTGSNAFAISGSFGSPVYTQLQTTTNSTDGYNVTVYASNAGSRTTTLLRAGGTGGSAQDQISDSVQVLQATQGANDTLTTSSDTGLAFRLIDASTSSILREADEDTQWGANDAGGALWASFPLGSGAAQVVYDTTTYSGPATTAFINWFVGVSSDQQTGLYSGTITFTASVN